MCSCSSDYADDASKPECQDWCSAEFFEDHCSRCKCKGCANPIPFPPPEKVSTVELRMLPLPQIVAKLTPRDIEYFASRHGCFLHYATMLKLCDPAAASTPLAHAAPTLSTAAAAAARLGTRPQGPCGPAPALPRLLVRVVCFRVVHVGSVCSPPCRAREAMFA